MKQQTAWFETQRVSNRKYFRDVFPLRQDGASGIGRAVKKTDTARLPFRSCRRGRRTLLPRRRGTGTDAPGSAAPRRHILLNKSFRGEDGGRGGEGGAPFPKGGPPSPRTLPAFFPKEKGRFPDESGPADKRRREWGGISRAAPPDFLNGGRCAARRFIFCSSRR